MLAIWLLWKVLVGELAGFDAFDERAPRTQAEHQHRAVNVFAVAHADHFVGAGNLHTLASLVAGS